MTLIAASVGAMMLFTFGIEVALRPSLGPTDNVNRALLSEESMDPEAEAEGTGPARRRYVRPGSNAIGTTKTLVTDVTARRRRRNPAL